MDKIQVAIVEDDLGWLKALTSFLNKQDDILVEGTATNREDAVNLARTSIFDVIIMDINLNENKRDGILAAVEILQSVKVKIIMLTSLKDDEIITDSFTAGAVNYISKENYIEIPNAIRTAIHNDSPIEVLLNEFSKLKRDEQLKELSGSEKQVYDLLEKGYTKAGIESKLYKTANTVKSQVKHILRKLGVSNSKEAVLKVKTKGLLKKDKD
ncbi:MAG TPA: response regulator transcription factor [Clostridia bacterium]|nr:response regulator transcription factor [Clostridia bacterium]